MTKTKYGLPLKWLAENTEAADLVECVLWPFSVNVKGYPQVRCNGKLQRAHLLVCAERHGERPAGMVCCHSCGNKLCVNPNHLRWGTPSDNEQDKVGHGTALIGQSNPMARLSETSVSVIVDGQCKAKVLAAKFGVSTSTINDIRRGKTWSWLTGK